MRLKAALAACLAPLLLGGCDYVLGSSGPYPEPVAEMVAPLKLTGRVVDAADVLPPEVETELTDQLDALEAATKAQMVVVTSPNLQGMTIEEYGLALGNSWGIGDAKRDDGVLLIVAAKDRKTRIEVGVGLEQVLTDTRSTEVVADMLVKFREADYPAGIKIGVDQVDQELRKGLKADK